MTTSTTRQQRPSTTEASFPARTSEELRELLKKVPAEKMESHMATEEEEREQYNFVRGLVAAVEEAGGEWDLAFEWLKEIFPQYRVVDEAENNLANRIQREAEPGLFFHILKEWGVDVPAQKPDGVLAPREFKNRKNRSGKPFTNQVFNTDPEAFAILCGLFQELFPKLERSAIRARANDCSHPIGYIRIRGGHMGGKFVDVKLVPGSDGRRNSLADLMWLDVDSNKMAKPRARKYLEGLLDVLTTAEMLESDGEGRYRLGPARWR